MPSFIARAASSVLLVALFFQTASAAAKKGGSDVSEAVKASNQFAGELYGRLSADSSDNLLISPYSVLNALQGALAGAKGETQQQMVRVLHCPAVDANAYRTSAALRTALPTDPFSEVQLKNANRLWLQSGIEILPSFLHSARIMSGAEPTPLDFAGNADGARQTINVWVEKQTQRKIRNLVSAEMLTQDTRLVLTSAVHFKGGWSKQFSVEGTAEAPFHVSAARDVMVPMMWKSTTWNYAETEEMQIVELPYGENETCSMLILLPRNVDGLAGLEKKLTGELNEWSSPKLTKSPVNVRIPRFEFSREVQLQDVLGSMGMPLAFDPDRADFSGISSQQKLWMSAIVHKAFIMLDEQGAEAAAATAVAVAKKKVKVRDPVEFTANHPFLFMIRENATNIVLFIGRVVNPNG